MTVELESVYERLLAAPGVTFLLGGIDSGKTTFGTELARRAVDGRHPHRDRRRRHGAIDRRTADHGRA